MKPVVHKQPSQAIVYDPGCMDLPAAEAFSMEYWQEQGALSGQALGRGSAWFVDAPFGAVVLRQYLRGGWAAKLSRRHYFFTTAARSRPFREFDVLASLYQAGLPVPRPVAALCRFQGIFATGAILTKCIAGTQTLADALAAENADTGDDAEVWAGVGKCIRRFHEAGVWHADLNARNILLDADAQVFLIDFDRARLTPGKPVDGRNNLARLKRSLDKLWPGSRASGLQSAWEQLLAGYRA